MRRTFFRYLASNRLLYLRELVVTVDVQKAFDSVPLFNNCIKKVGFWETFINWIQILLINQESCTISGGTTTKYFKLGKGARKGDPISAYLCILVLEIAFIFIK